MSAKSYVTDELLYNGRAYSRGEQVDLNSETRDRLLESGQISDSKPKDRPAADVGPDGTAQVTIADFSDEEILSEAQDRGLVNAGEVDYSQLNVEELTELANERGIEVKGSGKDGNVVKADLLAALAGDGEQA